MNLELHFLFPELLVIATSLACVTVDILVVPAKRWKLVPLTAAAGLAAALLFLLLDRREGAAVYGHFTVDAFSRFTRTISVAGGLLLVAIAAPYTKRMDRGHGEFYALLLLALTGVMLVAGVADFMSLFVSVELITISSYVLAAFKRQDPRSTEAGLKYLIVGAVSSAFLLFGIALVYGAVGAVDFSSIAAHVAGKGAGALLSLGTVLVFMGLFFKAAAVPMQVWAPDVYEGAPSPVTGFLSSLSKSAGFVLLLRIVQVLVVPSTGPLGIGAPSGPWATFLGVIAGLTLLYGNLGAIAQKDVKRLLAYSSIGHAGYLMMGVTVVAAAGTPQLRQEGAAAVLVYLLAYYVTTLTAFAVVCAVSAEGRGHDAATSYAGLSRRSPLLAFAMLLALLSLAGVPPLAGLIGKFLVFYAVMDTAKTAPGLTALGVVGALSVIFSLYFYLLLIREMYAKPPLEGDAAVPLRPALAHRVAVYAGIGALLVLGIFWGPVLEAANSAAAALFSAGR